MVEATSCGGVVIFRGKILLLYKNYKNKYEGWVLPKGTVEEGEEFKDTAIREVKEETGYDVEVKSLLFIREAFKEETHRIEFMFICETIGEADTKNLEYDTHQIGTKWISIDNITHEELHPADLRGIIKRHFLGKSNDIYLGEME